MGRHQGRTFRSCDDWVCLAGGWWWWGMTPNWGGQSRKKGRWWLSTAQNYKNSSYSQFETVDLQPSIKPRLCFPAGLSPDSQSLCVCVCVRLPRVWPCLRLPVSLTRMHLLTRGRETIEGDNVSELSRRLWVRHTRTDLAVSFDLFHTWSLTRLPRLPRLSPATLSLPVIAVHLLGSVSAALSASLLQD